MRAQTPLSRFPSRAAAVILSAAVGAGLCALGCTPRSVVSSPDIAGAEQSGVPVTKLAVGDDIASGGEEEERGAKSATERPDSAEVTGERPKSIEEVATPAEDPGSAKVWDLDGAKILARTVDEVSGYELILVQTANLEDLDEDDDQRRQVALLLREPDADAAFEVSTSDVAAWADDYSVHLARLTPELFDLRVNTHHGEDNWYTEVEVAVWRLPAGRGRAESIWEGDESYSGVLDICLSVEGVSFVVEGEVVRRVMYTQRSYTPSQDGDSERVDPSECTPEPLVERSYALWPRSPKR